MKSGIKAVIFDWGGVLIDDPAPGLVAYCARTLAVSREAYKAAHGRHEEGFQRGTIAEREFWRRVCADLGVAEPQSPSLWGDAFHEVYSPKPEMWTLVAALRRGGYRTGLLSNTEAAAAQSLPAEDARLFDVRIFSCAVQVRKPERPIYQIALEQLGIAAEQAVFIDDKETYAQGAVLAGIHAICFRDYPSVIEELAVLGVSGRE